MPFQMKVQPLDGNFTARFEASKPAVKSRLKRLFERQFQSVLRISTAEKLAGNGDWKEDVPSVADFEPSSLCLDKMVVSFIEEGNNLDKPPRSRCNCFNGNQFDDSSDDDFADAPPLSVSQPGDAAEKVKSLVLCATVLESNLLSDAFKIVEKAKNSRGKDDRLRVIAECLRARGYDSSACMSKWESTASIPAGEHSYIDVIIENGRLILDIDFKSEFEIARSTKSYRAALQHLPSVFVGSAERLQQIVSVVSEAARQSLKKKGLHVAPWRKYEYMKAKWFSSYQRTTAMDAAATLEESVSVEGETVNGENEDVLSFLVLTSSNVDKPEGSCKEDDVIYGISEDEKSTTTPLLWMSSMASPISGRKVVIGLASVL